MLDFSWGQTSAAFQKNLKDLIVQGFFISLFIWLLICLTLTSVAAYSMRILYVLLIEWVSVYLSLSSLPFLLLTRSGTVHILHNNMSPALSQWWYSQHLALYHDLHFSYVSSLSSQRHHWVPQHLFPPHGYMWAHMNQMIRPTENHQSRHVYYYYSCSPSVSAVGSTRREGGVPAYINLSASSMLMIAMQYTSNPVYHCQLLECLMKHKQEVWKVCHDWQQLKIN